VYLGREHPLACELTIEECEGVAHDARPAPLSVIADSPVMPGHQERVAGVAAAVAAAQDVVDALKSEAALVEQALALDGVEGLLSGVAHDGHSVACGD
jgi:hypothetical protein